MFVRHGAMDTAWTKSLTEQNAGEIKSPVLAAVLNNTDWCVRLICASLALIKFDLAKIIFNVW